MRASVPESEFQRRLDRVRDRLAATGADAATWFGPVDIDYLTGFHHLQTERPVLLAVTADGVEVTVPRMEVERVTANPLIDRVHSYFDYPCGRPVRTGVEMLEGLGVDSVGADMDSAPAVMGYEGPPLSDFLSVSTQDWVGEMRTVKSSVEVELIEESVTWANLGHRYLAEYAEAGARPATVSQRASTDASAAMLDALGDRYVPYVWADGPVQAGFISGPQTALPHGRTANRRLERGDVLVTGAVSVVDGYESEVERTMFIGEPDDEQRQYFELMREAQSIALEAYGPGVDTSEPAERVWEFYEEQGITDLARHHVGHARGLETHEAPFVDRGSDGVMQPGHVYSVEPGIYTDEYGYRHSDTVVITEDGVDRLSHYPRDLESNIIR